MLGVVRHAGVSDHRRDRGLDHRCAAPSATRARSSANGLTSEFLGDYNYAVATRDVGVGGMERHARRRRLPGDDTYRQAFVNDVTGGSAEPRDADEADDPEESGELPLAPSDALRPGPNTQCPATFGNSDIFSGAFSAG